MTTENELLNSKSLIVVSFDICSSTSILEDLQRTENIKTWRDFIIWIKRYLVEKSKTSNLMIYKFTGDGWILLFLHDHPGTDLLSFLEELCLAFKKRFDEEILGLLESPPDITGISFGIDRGTLIKIIMNDKVEFVGRPLNVACRLQSAIKDKDKTYQYKILVTKHFYNAIKSSVNKYRHVEVKRKLRNIAADKTYSCIKIDLMKRKNKQ